MVFASGFPVGSVCVVPGCGERVVAKGLCRSHYNRKYYSGSPVKPNLTRLCPCCHKYFSVVRKDTLFCSNRCRHRYFMARKADPAQYPPRPITPLFDNTVELEESVKVATPTMLFTLDDVWEQCDGRCAVCGLPADLSLSALDPMGCEAVWKVDPADGGVPCLENRIIVHHSCRARQTSQGSVRRHAGGKDVTNGRSRKKGK